MTTATARRLRDFAKALQDAASDAIDSLVAECPELRDPGARGPLATLRAQLGGILETARGLPRLVEQGRAVEEEPRP